MDIQAIPFEIRAIVGKVELPISGYLALEIGDIIVLDQEIGSPWTITIANQKRFEGHPGLLETHKAITIEKKYG